MPQFHDGFTGSLAMVRRKRRDQPGATFRARSGQAVQADHFVRKGRDLVLPGQEQKQRCAAFHRLPERPAEHVT